MHDGINHLAFPFLFSKKRHTWNAEVILDDFTIGIRQVAELERHQGLVPHQRGAEPSPKSQKEHAPAAVTAERLHGCIVDQAHRSA